ncbi:hypothetical protein [Piscinibacter sp.]|jgi:hypothetical protein|uniref:hypothetical protein n=1 Tax=Piscinibacter sp. TaxID=1903157 RepID=UPI003559513B
MIKATAVEVWVWVLIYGGLISVALGLSIQRSEAALGWSVVTLGGIAAAVGAVLVYVRSRMKGET